MRTWFAILAFGGLWTVSLMTGGARAESVERQRADEVLQRLDGPDSQFTDLNVQKTVTPFETERPDETDA